MYLLSQVEGIYKKAHEAIRKDPTHKEPEKKEPPAKKVKRWNRAKLSLSERKNRVAQKKASHLKKLEGQAEPWIRPLYFML